MNLTDPATNTIIRSRHYRATLLVFIVDIFGTEGDADSARLTPISIDRLREKLDPLFIELQLLLPIFIRIGTLSDHLFFRFSLFAGNHL